MYIPPTFPFFFTIKIGYYHIYSSYFSCSDAFATTSNYYKYFGHWREKRGVWGGSAPSEARASNF